MARLSIEELCIKKIEDGIRGIKMGTRTVTKVHKDIEFSLKKLHEINTAMADELETKLMVVERTAEAKA